MPHALRRLALTVGIAALTMGPASGFGAAAAAPSRPSAHRVEAAEVGARQPKAPTPRFSPVRPVPAGDEVVTATADEGGYHLFAASAGGGWQWQPLATLQPGGYSEERWIGEQCLTGDGRYVVAVVAPWSAQNAPLGRARGGLAYAVDAHSGAVRPLLSGLALTYFDPGCGLGSTAALSRYLDVDESHSEVLAVDLASGSIRSSGAVAGQATSGVPVDGKVVAALGSRLVQLDGGTARTLATLPGPVFRITPGAGGAVDFLAFTGSGGHDPALGVYSYQNGAAVARASGPASRLRLFPGSNGRNLIAGADDRAAPSRPGAPATVAPGPRRLGIPSAAVPDRVSPAGEISVRARSSASTPEVLVRTSDGAAVSGSLPAPAGPSTALPPDLVNAATLVTGPCAVPRNDPRFQVPQPSAAMVDWAANLAGQGALVGSNLSPLRPNGAFNLQTGPYSPSLDFPLATPFGAGGSHVPRELLEGVFAQESNWHQASPHAPEGLPGNPYVADYYGFARTGTVDYTQADCGYGIGQITDGMQAPDLTTPPTALQQRVAVDYAENVAAAAMTLSDKFNELTADGITMNGNDPTKLEDWYFATWAYNSGINPQASTGGGGCTPTPTSCHDPDGNWGLGWTNNPANPDYDPQRHPFLHKTLCDVGPDGITCVNVMTYGDAANPQAWPYQEKVFGWMETGQLQPDMLSFKFSGTYDYLAQAGFFLYLPGVFDYCDSTSNCTHGILPGSRGVCQRSDFHCWWHHSASICPLGADLLCDSGSYTLGVGAPEPAASNPNPPECSLTLPAGTVVVNDEPSDLNLVGCAGSGWTSAGTFAWQTQTDVGGASTGLIDLHQLGAGFGGRMLFTHTEDPGDPRFGGTGVWTAQLRPGRYGVSVFVPDIGAVATGQYMINDGGRSVYGPIAVNQANYSNEWVSLGDFVLGPGANVSLSSLQAGGDGSVDLAYSAVAFTPVALATGGAYAALGDSYASGLGAGTYDPPTGPVPCYRSPSAYPRQYASASPFRGGTVHVACSGAVIQDIWDTSADGLPAQLGAVSQGAGLVTVTVGGNDADFTGVLAYCVQPHTTSCQAQFPDEDLGIELLRQQLVTMFAQVRQAAPAALVLAVTYPSIFAPGSAGIPGCPGIGAMTNQDVQWLIYETFHLDEVIARAALQVGVGVLDERYALAGHELCTAAPWVNSIQVTNPVESFHPTARGYQAMAGDLGRAVAAAAPGGASPTPVPAFVWAMPLPGVPDARTAGVLAHLLAPVSATPPIPYSSTTVRPLFRWPSGSMGQHCDPSGRVLQRDALAFQPTDLSCPVTAGTWQGPYDAQTMMPRTQQAVGSQVQIDHVISLNDAWARGAWRWGTSGTGSTASLHDDPRLVLFANDIYSLELLSVSQSSNGSKSSQTLVTWTPASAGNAAFDCTFFEMYAAVKYEWGLSVTTAEQQLLVTGLSSCP